MAYANPHPPLPLTVHEAAATLLDALDQAGLASQEWHSLVADDIRRAVHNLEPTWSWEKHHRLTRDDYYTVAGWLTSIGEKRSAAEVSAFARLALLYARQDSQGRPTDGVVELWRGRRAVCYLPASVFRFVHRYGWSPRTAAIAEAQFDLLVLQTGPLKPPSTAGDAGGKVMQGVGGCESPPRPLVAQSDPPSNYLGPVPG